MNLEALYTAGPTMHTTGAFSFTWLLVVIPLASAAVLLLGGRRTNSWGHLLGVAAPVASFVLGVVLFAQLIGKPAGERSFDNHLFSWTFVGNFKAPANFQIDPLSISFVLLITGVGSLIHIYSVGYMAHDPGRRRFFAYMNLFVSAMLLLVLADNYLALYVGWEGVGLASYLLIGFWYHKPSARTAATKAFVKTYTEGVRAELAGTGVTVALLCPGPVRTEFLKNAGMDERTFADAFPKFLWMPSREVARTGVDALDGDRGTVIAGLPSQLSTRLFQFMPRRLLLPLLANQHPGLRRDRSAS